MKRTFLALAAASSLVPAALAGQSRPRQAAPSPATATRSSSAVNERFQKAFAEFTTFYERGLRDNQIVGSSIVLLRDGQVVASRYSGLATLGPDRPVDAATIYHWASITKTLTSIAIMQLRDRGRLRLDDPIVKYVPELREVHDPFGDVGEITLRHLMSHSAGFRAATWPWGGDKEWHPHEPTRWEQLVAMFPYTEILFQPGTRYSYSNPGVVFLGRVIELLSGDDFEVYIDKNIFKPLQMYQSYFDRTPYHLLEHRSASFFVSDGTRRPARFDFDTGITTSNGGWNAPLGDVVKYLDFLMGDPARSAVHEAVLKRSSLEEMFVPQVPVATEGGDRVAMGLAFFVEDYEGVRFIAHSGGQEGFISHFYFDPAARVGYIVAFNTEATTSGKEGKHLTRALDAALRQQIMKNLLPLLRR